MTSKNSRFIGLKKLTLLPVLAILFVFFTKKVNAQTETSANVDATIPQKQDVMSFKKKNATKFEKKIITFSKKTRDDIEVKKDTIKEKQNVSAPVPPPPPPPPSEFEQVPAEFPGGAIEFRKLVLNNFDTSIFKGDEGLIKTTVYLSIDEKGKISNIFAEGENKIFNAEAVKAITVANDGKIWKPATEDSNPVKTVFKLPLTMQFAGPPFKK